MPNQDDIALIAHLMRRAGFGASRAELETFADRGYEWTVEWLLNPEAQPDIDEYQLYRYMPMLEYPQVGYSAHGQAEWFYRMVNGQRPLQEKIALFWHQVFATATQKVWAHGVIAQVNMFREKGLGSLRDLLVAVAQDPAMIKWLDNQESHKRSVNENWGRELLELFSLGVGNYTETDVYECARAFTGWTTGGELNSLIYASINWSFKYDAADHDRGDKVFLGHSGNLDGDEIIDIIVQQPACHSFIARHLYNFFVADEPQVPAWQIEEPRDPEGVRFLMGKLVEFDLEIRPVLRSLFNTSFFQDSMYQKVKSPAEVVAGTTKIIGTPTKPSQEWFDLGKTATIFGQDLLNPPTVEGWHTGYEWINSGALVSRVNYTANQFRRSNTPGIDRLIDRIVSSSSSAMSPEQLVEKCLDLMGPLPVRKQTKRELVDHVSSQGKISWATPGDHAKSSQRTRDLMALIAGTREYQFN